MAPELTGRVQGPSDQPGSGFDWLRQRNNTPRLREVVLDEFISVGEQTGPRSPKAEAPPVVAKQPTALPPRTERSRPHGLVDLRPSGSVDQRVAQTLIRQVPIVGLSQTELESRLWAAANALRGPVDPSDFKAYIFPLLFYKRVCDAWDEEHEKAASDYDDLLDDEIEADYHRFVVPEGCHWDDLRARYRKRWCSASKIPGPSPTGEPGHLGWHLRGRGLGQQGEAPRTVPPGPLGCLRHPGLVTLQSGQRRARCRL